eukprot:scaffold123639_cov17-Tisochrysis_lutea.AAC.1
MSVCVFDLEINLAFVPDAVKSTRIMSKAGMASPELQEELEALQWTYGDEVQVSMDDVDGQRVHAIHAKLFPNTGEREEQRFVEATLLLTGVLVQ